MESQLTVDARDPMFVPMPSFVAARDPLVVSIPSTKLTIQESRELPHVLLPGDGLLKATRLSQTPLHVKDAASFINRTSIPVQEFQDEFEDLFTEAIQEFHEENELNTQDSLYTPAAACAYDMLAQLSTQIKDDEYCIAKICNEDAAASVYSMLPQIHAHMGHDDSCIANMCNEDLELSQLAYNQNLKDIGEEVAKLALQLTSKRDPWWKAQASKYPLTCPFTGFPIKFLPYPPYKMTLPSKSTRVLVDGKSLALTMISTLNFVDNGWCAEKSDVVALGDYIHRCKLGRHGLRPDRAMALVKDIGSPKLPYAEQEKKKRELIRMISAAKEELKKLRCVQEQRLLRLYQEFKGDARIDMIEMI